MTTTKCIVLYSSGMDSTVLLEDCIEKYNEVYVLTFDYNQRHRMEVENAKKYIEHLKENKRVKVKEHHVVKLDFFSKLATKSALTNTDVKVPLMKDIIGEPQPVTYCPNRNMILLSIAASYAESIDATHIAAGMVELDNLSGYWDCTEEFVTRLNNTLALNRMKHIEVVSPLVTYTKKDIILRGIELGVNFSKTRTCYTEHEVSCGECPSCAGRIKGWIQTKKYRDPLPYKKEVNWDKFKCFETA